MLLNMQAAFNKIAPLLIRNLLTNNRNPHALDSQRDAHDKLARPMFPQTVKPPSLHDTGELKDKFARAFAAAGMVARYDMSAGGGGKWEESKHPRASDGRFGNKAGQHGGGEPSNKPLAAPKLPDTPKPVTAQTHANIAKMVERGEISKPEGDALGRVLQKKQQPQATQPQPKQPEPPKAPPAAEPKKDGSQTDEPTTPPPPGGYAPDPTKVNPQTGYADAARVGVPGMQSPPPPSKIPRLPNLTHDERKAENAFASAFEADPDGMANRYMQMVMSGVATKDGTNVFATDDAKKLSGDWNPQGVSEEESFNAKAIFNTAVHQTANAVAKRAFTQYLDQVVSKLPDDQKFVLVTAGGVASGKGFAIGQVGEVNSLSKTAGAVWDSAGEQNSSELPWVQQECQKRGLGMVCAYIHATPDITWPRAVGRANTQGRMVDARVFADSYEMGAKNFENFRKQHANNPNVKSIVIDNTTGQAKILPEVPNVHKMSADRDYKFAMDWINNTKDVPGKPGPDGKPTTVPLKPAIKRAATAGTRIWGQPASQPPAQPSVPGQQQSLFSGPSQTGQQSLFNVVRKPATAARAPSAGAAQSLLSQATPDQRRVLAAKPTLSPADLAIKPQAPSKPGQKALFSRARSGMVALFADAFSRVGL